MKEIIDMRGLNQRLRIWICISRQTAWWANHRRIILSILEKETG
jgi:hypothetical protein